MKIRKKVIKIRKKIIKIRKKITIQNQRGVRKKSQYLYIKMRKIRLKKGKSPKTLLPSRFSFAKIW